MTTLRFSQTYLTVGFAFLMGTPALGALVQADDGPDSIQLTGIVRDFRQQQGENGYSGHSDFEEQPDHGFGQYTGNIWLALDDDGKPVYVGGGHQVQSQARNAAGIPIAPHLYNSTFKNGGDSGLPEHTSAILRDSDGVDAFEVTLESALFNSNGTSTWTYSIREFGTGKDLSHWLLRLDPSHIVMSGTTPGYELGVDHDSGIYGIKWDVNDDFEEGTFVIVLDQHYAGDVDWNGVVVKSGNESDHEGLFVPDEELSQSGYPFPTDGMLSEGENFQDSSAQFGPLDSGAITSPDSFNQWYRDVPGVNMSKTLTLTFNRQPDGSYVFDDALDPEYSELGGFFPIENALFGNPGGNPDRNFHFTFELGTEFTYQRGTGQVFSFTGDDDVWVFIDHRLVIDIGGVHGAVTQSIDLDRLDWLADGEEYQLKFFFAERHRTQSNFRIATNLILGDEQLATISPGFD